MSSENVNLRRLFTSALVIAAVAAVFVSMYALAPAAAQQPPAGGQQPAAGPGGPGADAGAGGRGGRGGGFRDPDPLDFEDHEGWTQIFDGSSLDGWDGNPDVWKVEDEAITATSTPEKPTGTTYLLWKGGNPGDFELKWEMMVTPTVNSGLQYRSMMVAPRERTPDPDRPARPPQDPRWNIGGYQFDFDYGARYVGQLYENAGDAKTGEDSRGIVTPRGYVVQMKEGQNARIVASLGAPEELKGYYNIGNWNQCHLIVRGGALAHIVNGHLMSLSFDDDPAKLKSSGILALQIEGNGTVSYRNIWLREW